MRNLKQYLPSKKFVLILLLCLIVLAAALLINKKVKDRRATNSQQSIEELKGTAVTIKDVVEKDTDSDSIPDWEEVLWGTDPTKKDSDNDGISDDIVIENKRKSVEAENQGDIAEKPGEAVSAETSSSLNETQNFSRELFASIAALEQSGNLNDQTLGELATTVGQNAAELQNIPDFYTASDVQSVSDSKEAIKKYHEDLVAVFNKHADSNIGGELSIIDQSLGSGDKKSIEDLYAISVEYKNLADDLAHINVPNSAIETHLEIVNSSRGSGIALENIAHIYDNSLKGLIGISQYQKQSDAFDQTFDKLRDYFKKNGIL